MEAAATASASWPRLPRAIDSRAISAWLLSGALVVYLALSGGGYASDVHDQVGLAVWWIVVIGAAFGLLPVAPPTRWAWIVLALFAAFVGWTALALTWSISRGRSLDDLSLVTCYLGVFVLAISIHRERSAAVKHTVNAVATAIVVVAALAVATRIWPHLITTAQQTGTFLGGARARLSWPLNYWNALAAFVDLGIPLLLGVATSARTLRAQAAAAAALPLVALCAALTLSRGGVIAGTIAVLAFLALAPDRLPKLLTTLVAGSGSTILIAAAFDRHALQLGLVNPAAQGQGASLLVIIVLVCAGVGLTQAGIGLAVRHGTPPRWLTISPSRARAIFGLAAAIVLIGALVAGAPNRVEHLWREFKQPHQSVPGASISRFGSTSGEGRYQYWSVAVNATHGHLLAGSGPGTFQLLWLPRAPFESYVINAHSLYMETLAELGVIGLGLLAIFLAMLVVLAVRLAIRSSYEERTRAAGVAAALLAFIVYAAFDWVWQIPAIPVVVLLLAAAVVAPRFQPSVAPTSLGWRRAIAIRAGVVAVGIASIIAIAFPLATSTALTQSRAAATAGNLPLALTYARQAAALEPTDAAAQMQVALVLESGGAYPEAVAAAQRAVGDEPQNWSNWLVLSRLYAEAGQPADAVVAYREARTLNPHSPLFRA